MRKTKFIILATLICSIAAAPVYAQSPKSKSIKVFIDGKQVNFNVDPIIKNGRMLVEARRTFGAMGANVEWYENEGKVEVDKEQNTFTMYIDGNEAFDGNEIINMGVAPVLKNGTVMVPLRFLAEKFGEQVSFDSSSNRVLIGEQGNGQSVPVVNDGSAGSKNDYSKYKVVIDPGHGGSETGAIVSGIYEKNLNLQIAKKLNTLLKAAGVKTYMTRTDDRYVSLYARSGFANSVDADLFISVHNNAQTQKSVSGTMSLYYPNGTNTNSGFNGYKFASIVQNNLNNALGTMNLGIISRPHLAVLRTSKMPAVLAEVGYMTNKNELNKLLTDSFKTKAAKALSDSVLQALKKL
ncbi:MAG: N-acetylmuramoyl-L-alanine amidase [Bacillota bacterium]|nr:N-acetylmuramoyl-L-alanine amidase [Bacillota bacterium]